MDDLTTKRLDKLRKYAAWERENRPNKDLHILDWAADLIERLQSDGPEHDHTQSGEPEHHVVTSSKDLLAFLDNAKAAVAAIAERAPTYEIGMTPAIIAGQASGLTLSFDCPDHPCDEVVSVSIMEPNWG